MKVPGGSDVSKAILSLRSNLKACLRQVNQQAGRLLAKGDYARAESLVEVAKAVESLRADVEELQNRWRGIKGARDDGRKEAHTPLWEYYQPILQALQSLGGAARIGELEAAVGEAMNARLKEGDLRTMARGRPRWQIMVRKARRYMVKEGLLEGETGPEWRITAAGSKAAAGRQNRG